MREEIRRGVFRSHLLTAEGYPFLIAVASDRRAIARATVYPWDDEDQVAASLERVLNREDPAPAGWG